MEFQEDTSRISQDNRSNMHGLLLNLDGFEGPIDVLLLLARDQKVDLRQISILQLARQYLEFIETAKQLKLDLAAEYLVMASWLAYLKSKLLLPATEEDGEEPSAEQMAEALAYQLERLEAMRRAAETLMKRPKTLSRGEQDDVRVSVTYTPQASLYDLLDAYGKIKLRAESSHYAPKKFLLMSMDDAFKRMEAMLGRLPMKGARSVWATLSSFMPEGVKDKLFGRSSMASLFTASLEMSKQGQVELQQDGLFKPIYLRRVS